MRLLVALSFLISSQCFAYFTMHQKIVNNAYKICLIGDTGTGTDTQKLMGKLLAQENCAQVRVLGDVIYPSGLKNEHDLQYFDKFYLPFKEVINSKNRPLFHIITGNHDYKQDEYVWIKLHNKFHYLFAPALNYVETYDQGRICFFNIDTTVANNFKLSRTYKTFKWIRSQLAGHSRCKLKLAFGHHPYKSSGAHGNASGMIKYFLKHSIIGKVDAYFSGHDHQLSYEGKSQGTELFISGSFAKSRPLEKKPPFATSEHGLIVLSINETPEEYLVHVDFKALENKRLKTVFNYSFAR